MNMFHQIKGWLGAFWKPRWTSLECIVGLGTDSSEKQYQKLFNNKKSRSIYLDDILQKNEKNACLPMRGHVILSTKYSPCAKDAISTLNQI
jgi:hypothetical protein